MSDRIHNIVYQFSQELKKMIGKNLLNKKQVRNPLPQQGREGLVPSVATNCYL